MPTDKQIAVMVEVAQTGGAMLNASQEHEIPVILAEGLISPAPQTTTFKYKLTDKGQKVLDDRGVGANES